MNIDNTVLDAANAQKITDLKNSHVEEVVEKYINMMKPAKVTVITDSSEDIEYVRKMAIKNGEEAPLATKGHTVHYDGYSDQARDKANTKVLVKPDMKMSKVINTLDREEGIKAIYDIMDGIMEGKEVLVRFFCLGPLNSRFSIPALQITDSAYVAHSEDILYRSGYQQFKNLKGSDEFFYLVHSAGKLDERGNSIDIDKRRIYIDVTGNRVFTMNNQYAGNSLGLKKLALRLAIFKANNEDWLTEHMFVMGVQPDGKNRKTYFAGAFPSACGKTSTAMIPGQTIVGDDIAYIREGKDGLAYAVNIEQGIFGIIEDVNPDDDPLIYETLTSPRELIFSNILVNDGKPYWLGMGQELPDEGINHYGDWKKGMKDESGKEVGPAHKNARYTVRIEDLENVDEKLHDPEGVPVHAVIYGGRDSDTSVPVYQSLDWHHGVLIGSTLESESTAATLGAVGVRNHSPMANMDFLVVPLGKYIENHLKFGGLLKETPLVFATNYFLKDTDDKFYFDKIDKKVWIYWMEGRVHGEYGAIETPVGYIPKYEDIKKLFSDVFGKNLSREKYEESFAIRVNMYLDKIDRMEKVYAGEEFVPHAFDESMAMLKKRLVDAKNEHGMDVIPPSRFE
jgi:phosphoenolpyruvate carboxykinase (GTP)